MATGQVSAGYAIGGQAKVLHTPFYNEPRKKQKIMKQTLKSRLRSWLFDEQREAENSPMYVEEDRFQSSGVRLQIYKASGGFVIETRGYDRIGDRNKTSMHVITDEQDLGEELGKIVMMEALKG